MKQVFVVVVADVVVVIFVVADTLKSLHQHYLVRRRYVFTVS